MSDLSTQAQSLFERGLTSLATDDAAEAIESLTRAITLVPRVAAGYRYRARAYVAKHDRARAFADLNTAVKLAPDDPDVLADRATLHLAQRAYEQAVADCTTALVIDPGRADLHGVRARAYAAWGHSEAALSDFAVALVGDPDHAVRYLLDRGRLHLDCQDVTSATADASEVLRLTPTDPEAWYFRAVVREQVGDLAGAEVDFGEVLRLAPRHRFATLARAVIRLQLRNAIGAVADADAVLEQASGAVTARAHEVRGLGRKALGQYDLAYTDFTQLMQLLPHSPTGFLLRAELHHDQGEDGAAVRDLVAALQVDPRNAVAFNRLGWLWATSGDAAVRDPARATEAATRACELTEWKDAECLDTLAAAYAAAGDGTTAVKWQEEAVRRAANDEQEVQYGERLTRYRAGGTG